MLFNSSQFLLLFLPATLVGYLLLTRFSNRAVVPWLVLASLVFYGAWNISYLPLLVGSLVANFLLGRAVAEARSARRAWLVVGIAANLALLGYYKYSNFAFATLGDIWSPESTWETVVLPIGISFFTFQQIAYLVDSHHGTTSERSFLRYALFIVFFPQLIAGPIIHHGEIIPQLGVERSNRRRDLAEGLTLLVIGLAKKLWLADSVATSATRVFDAAAAGGQPAALEAWLGAIAYGLQIYFDFSAYSDMATGLSRMFGIDLPVNFASPYKATSIVDFWRRWHITLSRFLRDYLYISLGGNRRGPARQKVNLMLTMVLGGFWHGANWTFLVWGALHGTFLLINHAWQSTASCARLRGNRAWTPVARLLTLLCVVLAWVPFRATDLKTSALIWKGMFGIHGLGAPFAAGTTALVGILLAMALFAPNSLEILASAKLGLATRGYPATKISPHAAPARGLTVRWRPSAGHAAVVAALLVLVLVKLHDESEFIYFQF